MLSPLQKIKSFVVFLMIAFLIVSGTSDTLAQEQTQAMGELKIEGSHIEQLILRADNGRTETFNNPEETIKLSTGTYYLNQVNLKNGFLYNLGNNRIVITEDKPAVLKVGAPLKQTVDIKRQGRFLILNYKLTGLGGESYRDQTRKEKPGFTVYKADKIIASGNFEYG